MTMGTAVDFVTL